MREILFRGKRKDNGEWVEGNLFVPDLPDTPTQICIGTNVIRITYDIIPETVGQFTGLTDKNGKKIFEGDIVKEFFWPKNIGVVSFEKGSFCSGMQIFYGWIYKGDDGKTENRALYNYDDDDDEPLEVIGNIHDNPELLKQKEE